MSRLWFRALLSSLGLIVVVFAAFGPLSAKLADVESNTNADYLPTSAESTRALQLTKSFVPTEDLPTIVLYERTDGPITDEDKARAVLDLTLIRTHDWLDGVPSPPVPSQDGKALQVYLPFDGKEAEAFLDNMDQLRELLHRGGGPAGLDVYVTGVGGTSADLYKVFNSIDGPLILASVLIVIVILLVVYRSPVLWLLPLLSAATAYIMATGILYLLAKSGVITVNAQSQAILTVLTFGAATDYALLLVARYREELHRHDSAWDAMKVAWRGATPAIIASSATVALGLLCLLASELAGNKGLGPVGAVGVACAALTSLFLMPAMLLLGRWLFWPRVPHVDGEDPVHEGFWSRLAARVEGKQAGFAIGTTVVLLLLVALSPGLKASGIPSSQAISSSAESVIGQERLEKHFPAGDGAPVQIIGPGDKAKELMAAAASQKGVLGVAPFSSGTVIGTTPEIKDGRVLLLAVLDTDGYSSEAKRTVEQLRERLDKVSKEALVGGYTAIDLDIRDASRRDNKVIIPIVLVLIVLVLALLLRAVVAPLVLIFTVVLSYGATLGACAFLFNTVFDYPGADAAFPLFAFVFLVALGVDYNIFLMTRVREESELVGTHEGMLRGLTVTGGVITSAGVVLAATFAALAFLPLVFAAEMGIAVAFGVLLDTLVVRSLLVPALVLKLGDRIWWPSKLARGAAPAERSR